MNKKLLIELKLLLEKFPNHYSKICRFAESKSITGKAALMVLFTLFSLSSYAQLPLQDFEGGSLSPWTQPVGATPQWTISTDGHLSSGAAFIDPSAENIGDGNTVKYYLFSPQFAVPANGQLRFFTKQSSATDSGNVYEIRLSTAGQLDPTAYTTLLKTWTEAELNPNTPLGYEEQIVSIPPDIATGINVYIAFVLINTQVGTTPNSDAWFIDDISVLESSVCDPVLAANFQATGITTDSANLSWTHPSTLQFEIQVVNEDEAPGATGDTTDNTFTAPDLEANTTYDVYIKAICTSSVSSAWAGPFKFTTLDFGRACDTPYVIPTGAPYVYSGNLDDFINPGLIYSTQGTNCLPSTVTGNYLNGNKAFFSYTATDDGVINIKQLTLPYSQGSGCFGNGDSGVFIYEDCASVGVNCLAGVNTVTAGVPKYISNFPVEAGQTYIIVISTAYDDTASVCFTFELNFSTCPSPNVYTYKNLLQDSVVFSWNNPENIASSWEYKAQPAGTGVPTGSVTATSTNVDNLINTGLTAGTAYDLYVRSVCNGTPGEWGIPYRFTTQCDAFPTPYTEDFPGASTNSPTACWTPVDINEDGNKWGFSWENLIMRTGTALNNNDDVMSFPMIDLGTTPKRLRFTYQTSSGVSSFSVVASTTGIGKENFSTEIMPTLVVDTNYDIVEKIVNIPTSLTGKVNLAFYVGPNSDETTNSVMFDDIVVEDKPACSDPLALSADGITTSSAVLSWEKGDAEEQWQIVVQLKDAGVPTGTGELIGDPNYTKNDLIHGTQYEYYVRAYCSSTLQSNWVGPFVFKTVCAVFDVPFYESFNDNDAATHKFCWTTLDANGDGAAWNMNATEPAIQGNPWWGTPEFDDWLISPAINVEGTKALKFKYRSAMSPFFANPRFGVEVLMSTTDTNPESFSVVMPLIAFTNIEYLEKTIYITANGPVYIAFRIPPSFSTADGTSILQIDDVRIEDAPACPPASDLMVKNITNNGAILSWAKGSLETQWEVKLQVAGTGVPTEGELTANNTAYPTGTLQPNTTYEYYVRSYCSDAEQSEWIGPLVFTTLCEAFAAPFIETFNPDSASEACWRVVNGNSDSYTWNLNLTLNPYEGEHTAGMFTGSNGNNDDWLISPTITVTAGQRLRYYYRTQSQYFNEDIDLKLSTTGIEPENFTTTLYSADYFDEVPLNNPEWKEKVINLPEGVTGNINIAWHIPKKEAHWQGFRGQLLAIDKVIIEDIPACPAPSNLIVVNVADTTAELKWDANGTEGEWDVYVQPAELDAPVGDGDAQYRHLASTNPYTVEGLTPAIKYEYYVRAACDSTNKSEWIGPFEFTTMCSFENLCEYTATLTSAFYSGAGGVEINVMQNGFKLQTMSFPTAGWTEIPEPVTYNLLLCTGVEFSLFFDSVGTAPGQYAGCTIEVKNSEGTVVWTGDIGDLAPRTNIYTGISTCGVITCPQPTDLAVSETSVMSWTAGGTEVEWEVAIQAEGNNTLPQSGTTVNTNSYTPQDSDFANLQAGTHEFFVRAVCGEGNTSFWSGPFRFVRNDDASKAIVLPVNTGEVCEQSATAVSFAGATASDEPMTCTGTNNGDVWFEFTASSKVHIVQLGNFSAKNIYQNGTGDEPKVGLTLYKVNGTDLEEMACTYNNVIIAAYSTELEVGATYKVRLTLNNNAAFSTLDVCVTTPLDVCKLDIFNGSFEKPEAEFGMGNFFSQNVVPGWRNNLLATETSLSETLFLENSLGLGGFAPYEGGQTIQLMTPDDTISDPADPNDLVNIRGMYQDLDSSEITKFAYSFAHLSLARTVEFFAGPPEGPFVKLEESLGSLNWSFHEGTYDVPAGQNVTRFIFRSKDMAIGNMLDAVSITAVTKLITEAHTLDCTVSNTQLEAEGVGTWVADENNPGAVVITDPTSTTTTVTDFVTSGEYTFYWRTRYCEYSVVITKEAVDEVPAVTSPITYCVDEVAAQLSAPALDGLTVTWFTDAEGGTGSTVAPTPATTVDGTTSYYVAYVNAEGCEGARAEIQVVVNPTIVPVVEFTYDETEYCSMSTNPVINLAAGFETGGTFKVTPEGLTLDTVTGAIDLSSSALGTYEITYTVAADGTVCNVGGAHSYTILVYEPLEVTIDRECRENGLWLKVVSADSTFDPQAVDYVWKDENGVTVGSNSPEFNVAEYYSQNGGLELPLYFTVSVGKGSCTSDADYTVTGVLCDVPRGISPNNDGKNDELDLTGFGVANISIFNRYGKEVYSHGKGYTKQWHGQDNKNNELPDGTYYYSITKADGSNTTGWVYINRQH